MSREPTADEKEITLGPEDALNAELLRIPSQQRFGEVDEPDLARGSVRLRVGRKPVAQNLRSLYKRSGHAIPEGFEVFWSHEIWILIHTVGVVRSATGEDVEHLCCETKFPEDTTVIDVLPQSRFLKAGDNRLICEADIHLSGRAGLPETRAELVQDVDNLYLDAQILLSKLDAFVGRVSFDVITTAIQAIGPGDNKSQFIFSRDGGPLTGFQTMIEILLVDKYVTELPCAARLDAVVTGRDGLPVRLRSRWIPLVVTLALHQDD